MNKAVGKILHDPTRNVRVGSAGRASLQGEPRLLPRRTPLSKGIACRLKLCASPDGACALGTHRDAAEARDAEPGVGRGGVCNGDGSCGAGTRAEPAGGACPGVHLGLERNAAKRAVRPVARDCGDARRLGSVHARKLLDDLRGKRAHRREVVGIRTARRHVGHKRVMCHEGAQRNGHETAFCQHVGLLESSRRARFVEESLRMLYFGKYWSLVASS